MQRFIVLSLFFINVLTLTACSNNDAPSTASSNVRIAHLSPETPAFNLRIGSGSNKVAVLNRFSYGRGSAFIEVEASTLTLEALDSGQSQNIFSRTINFIENERQTLLLVNTQDKRKLLTIIDNNLPASNQTELRIVHAAASITQPPVTSANTAVDIFISAPEIDIIQTTSGMPNNISDALANNEAIKLSSIEFEFIGDEINTLSPGNYRIRITTSGNAADLIYDSGSLSFTANTEFIVSIAPSVNNPVSTLALSVLNNKSIIPSRFFNDARVQIRAVNLSPDANNLDVLLNNIQLANNIAYRKSSTLMKSLSGKNTLIVNTANMNDNLINNSIMLNAGITYSILILNNLGNLETLLIQDVSTPTKNQAQVRVVHAAPELKALKLDIYITEPSPNINDIKATFTDLAFNSASNEMNFDISSPTDETKAVQIRVTTAGDTTLLFDSGVIQLHKNREDIITITQAVSDSTKIGLTILTYDNSTNTSSVIILD